MLTSDELRVQMEKVWREAMEFRKQHPEHADFLYPVDYAWWGIKDPENSDADTN